MAMSIKTVKFQGLTKKWVYNVLSVVFIIFFVFQVTLSFIVYTHYYNSVADYLKNQIEAISTSFASYSSSNYSEFEAGAKQFVESFAEKDKLEVQILNDKGKIIMSTSGFIMGDDEMAFTDSPELSDGKEKAKEKADVRQARLSSGEDVMVAETPIVSRTNSNVKIGAIRIMVSLRETNRQLFYMVATIILAGLFMFLIIFLTGMFFVRSIIKPVREVASIAKQIAMGDFDSRISSKSDEDEIGQLCETINYMAGELASTERMKNEFISSVSHELRTPLTAIKGWGETIKGSYDDPQLMEKGLEVIISESERLSSIVEDLLDFSRLQNGQLSYNLKTCDIIAELSEAVLTFTDAAKRGEINLIYNEPSDMPPIECDASRLQQVFVNIIDNAVKNTPLKGSIAIDAKLEGGHVVIMISDTGYGIPESELDHVKQKFFKGSRSTRGSGIGLAVANEIVVQHGGLLDIASTEHVGTTVTITLPLEGRK